MTIFALQAEPLRAEYRITPSLVLGEEYNDNIYLATLDRRSDYISRVVPALAFSYTAPLWDWTVSYAYDYRHYARTKLQNTDTTYRLSIANLDRLVNEFFFLALREEYSRVSLDVARDYTQQSSFVRQTEQNTASANPYFVFHPSDRTSVNAGYMYRNIWYKDPSSIDKTDHITSLEMKHELSGALFATAAARYTLDRNRVQDYDMTDLSAGLTYAYSGDSRLYGTIGNLWVSAEGAGRDSQVYWNAGLVQKFPKFTFTVATSLSYVEDPTRVLRRVDQYSAGITRSVERTSLSVTGSLSEYRNATTKHLEETRYSVSGAVSHSITTVSKVMLDLTIERLENNVYDTYTDLYLSGIRYEYAGWEGLTLSIAYRYTNNYDPYNYYGSYYNNRFFVELNKVF